VVLFEQGQRLGEVFNLVRGIIKLTQVGQRGRESIPELALPGSWIGTAPVLANRPAPVRATTCTDSTLRRMTASSFQFLVRHDPELSAQIHEAHSVALCRQATRIGLLSTAGSRERLLCVICQFIAALQPPRSGGVVKLALPIRQWELARFLAISPEHLNRLFKLLEADGALRRQNGWLIIPDVDRLCSERRCDV